MLTSTCRTLTNFKFPRNLKVVFLVGLFSYERAGTILLLVRQRNGSSHIRQIIDIAGAARGVAEL